MDSIAKANKRPVIRGRNGQVNELGGGNLYFHNLGVARDVFDARTGTRHVATTQDAKDAVRLLDALPNCHTVTPFFTPPDVSNEMLSLHMYRGALSYTTKPVQGPGIQFGHEVRYAVEMAAVVGTPAHELTLSLSPVSPTMHDIAAEAIMEMAKYGVIHASLPCPTGGATSPMTITIHFTARSKDFQVNVTSKLVGAYNVSNCLAALTAAVYGLGIKPEVAAQGIVSLDGIPGRMERIDMGQPFTVIVDFAHTPNALKVTLDAARDLTPDPSPERRGEVFSVPFARENLHLVVPFWFRYALRATQSPAGPSRYLSNIQLLMAAIVNAWFDNVKCKIKKR